MKHVFALATPSGSLMKVKCKIDSNPQDAKTLKIALWKIVRKELFAAKREKEPDLTFGGGMNCKKKVTV